MRKNLSSYVFIDWLITNPVRLLSNQFVVVFGLNCKKNELEQSMVHKSFDFLKNLI